MPGLQKKLTSLTIKVLLGVVPLVLCLRLYFNGGLPTSESYINTSQRYYAVQTTTTQEQRYYPSGINDSDQYKTIGNWTKYPEITFTNLQWYQPSELIKPTAPRCLIMRDFADSVEAHPRYNASLWSTLHNNPDPERPILAFLDADLCGTVHWPIFGSNRNDSFDREHSRPSLKETGNKKFIDVDGKAVDECNLIDMALNSPALKANSKSRLFVISCEWQEGPPTKNCLGPERNATKYKQLVIGHLSKQMSEVNAQDFGIAPFPVKTLNNFPREQVCNNSLPYLISFKGRNRLHFFEFNRYFKELAKTRDDIYMNFGVDHYQKGLVKNSGGETVVVQTPEDMQANETYYQLMTQSTFCPVPRGDNIFSVRFSEILSAGCIPIIYANGWVLPYTRAIVDWYKVAVIIPQQNVHHTLDYIEQMTEEEICERRLMAYDFFHQYVKTGKERLDAIVRVMDERLRTGRLEPFQAAPGIASHPDSLDMYQKDKWNNGKNLIFERYKNSLP